MFIFKYVKKVLVENNKIRKYVFFLFVLWVGKFIFICWLIKLYIFYKIYVLILLYVYVFVNNLF